MGGMSKSLGGSTTLAGVGGSFSSGRAQQEAQSFTDSGYTGLPTVVSGEAWDKAVADSEFPVIYRGISASTQDILDDYNTQLERGDLYVMSGAYGTGMYGAAALQKGSSTTVARSTANEYSDLYDGGVGRVREMVLKPGSTVADYFTLARSMPRSAQSVTEYAIKQGYSALRNNMDGEDYYIVLNRSALTMKR